MRREFLKSPLHAALALATLGLGFATGEPLYFILGAAAYVLGWVYLPDLPAFGRWVDAKQKEQLDAAVLDRNLGGHYSDSVAQRLRDRGILFAVVTGYADTELPLEFADVPSLAKPFEPHNLVALVARLISSPRN